MTSRYARGRSFEYVVRNRLLADGFLFVSRLPSSKHFDLVGWDGLTLFLVECKLGSISKFELEQKRKEAAKMKATFMLVTKDEAGVITKYEYKDWIEKSH
jgi:Holliday junction resolvase